MIQSAFARLLDTTPPAIARMFSPGSRAVRVAKPLIDRLIPREKTPVTVRAGLVGGTRMLIDPRNEKYYWTGLHEPEIQAALAAALAPGFTCWDVGAHAGFFTILSSRLVGSAGTVHAFEPGIASFAQLEWAVAVNGLDNARLHKFALAGVEGQGMLFDRGSTLMASLRSTTGSGGRAVPVPCRTIDSLAADFGIPDVVKIDVEGLELDVLAAGRATFAEGRTTAIVELANPEREAMALKLLPGYKVRRVSSSNWIFEPLTFRPDRS